MPQSFKKLASMTPLQILCSFQTWNAAPITIKQHKALAEVVDSILNRGADPNSVAAKNTVAGSVSGTDRQRSGFVFIHVYQGPRLRFSWLAQEGITL